MDYKKKYEEALENIKKIKSANKDNKELVDFIEYEYPELRESEDERIRKELISFITDRKNWFPKEETKASWIAWLEKMSTDKVEPKFKVGDWIYHEISGNTFHINKIENGLYVSDEGATISLGRQNDWRPWTIKDAKDSDVLASNRSIFSFQREYIADTSTAYCSLMNNLFIKDSDGCWTNEKYYPATQEQLDILFQKMKEAGYEWDAENKELRKIEQKLSWSEEDEKYFNVIYKELESYIAIKGYYTPLSCADLNWFKSLKERMKGE